MSGNPLSVDLSPDAHDSSKLTSLKSVIMLNTPIALLSDLAVLSSRTSGVQTLRYSVDPGLPLEAQPVVPRLTGNSSEDRSILVALFSKLTMLNGTDVRPKERDEAERRYLQSMSSWSMPDSSGAEWRIYDQLAKKHGQASRSRAKPASSEVQPHTLRSKLISTSLLLQSETRTDGILALHIYPADQPSFTLTILPSAPVTLLRRKIAKKMSQDPDGVSLHTTRRSESSIVPQADDQEVWVNEKVARVEEGEVGYWFDDGDGVMIE